VSRHHCPQLVVDVPAVESISNKMLVEQLYLLFKDEEVYPIEKCR